MSPSHPSRLRATAAALVVAAVALALFGTTPAGAAPEGMDMRGGQVWPGLVDAHTHLDKGHIWPRMRNADGTFAGAINAVMADRGAAWSEADIEARADFSLRAALDGQSAAALVGGVAALLAASVAWPGLAERFGPGTPGGRAGRVSVAPRPGNGPAGASF